MEFQSYNEELALASLLFKKLFSNIRIQRTLDNGEKKETLVKCVLGQRSRIMKALENPERKGIYTLPLISINRTGYSRNGERLNNLNNEVKYELGPKSRYYHLMAPVPVDINYEVTVMSKYQADIDKIASNFMVFFNSDLFVSCEHPKYEGIKMNCQVVMQDSVSEEHPDDLSPETDDFVTAVFQFTFKTFLFAGMEKYKKRQPTILSSQQVVTLSNIVVVLRPSEIDDFQKKYPTREVSALVPQMVTADISVEIPNPELSGDDIPEEYEPIPAVRNIDSGFYVVPAAEAFDSYITSVDQGLLTPHKHYGISGYISSEAYISTHLPKLIPDPYSETSSMLSIYNEPLQTSGDYYEKTTSHCSLYPYKDPIRWAINPFSKEEFPNNVEVYNDMDLL